MAKDIGVPFNSTAKVHQIMLRKEVVWDSDCIFFFTSSMYNLWCMWNGVKCGGARIQKKMHLCLYRYADLRFEKSCNGGARQTVRSALLAVALLPLRKLAKLPNGVEELRRWVQRHGGFHLPHTWYGVQRNGMAQASFAGNHFFSPSTPFGSFANFLRGKRNEEPKITELPRSERNIPKWTGLISSMHDGKKKDWRMCTAGATQMSWGFLKAERVVKCNVPKV